jgi:hypothetical protein
MLDGLLPAWYNGSEGRTDSRTGGAMVEISDFERQEIRRYLKWDGKKLFRELDRYYGASSPGGEKASYRFKGKGRVWFNELLPRLQELVCDEWDYQAKKEEPELQENEGLVVALGEAIAPLIQRNPFPTGAQVPIYLVAAILVHSDLDQLCGGGDK